MEREIEKEKEYRKGKQHREREKSDLIESQSLELSKIGYPNPLYK